VVLGAVLAYKAAAFGKNLSKAMATIESAKPLIKTINFTINLAIVCTSILFCSVFLNFYAQSIWGPWWNFTFWVTVHFCGEFGLVFALYTTKRNQEKKTIKAAKDSTATTTASVMDAA
ncbi:hypothetical protein TeGR_g15140, partial [Tetraparma gracilis]